MKRKIIIFAVIFAITVLGLFFIKKNSVFAACGGVASCCQVSECVNSYCSDPCRETSPGVWSGVYPPDNTLCLCNPLSHDTLEELIASIISFIFLVATVIFPLMVAIAAFLFTTSAGNPTKVGQAKNIIIYASVGYGIVVLAHALVYVIKNVIGAV